VRLRHPSTQTCSAHSHLQQQANGARSHYFLLLYSTFFFQTTKAFQFAFGPSPGRRSQVVSRYGIARSSVHLYIMCTRRCKNKSERRELGGVVRIIRQGRQDLTHLFEACSCPVHGAATVVILLDFLNSKPKLERDIQNILVNNV
jgi:hypothetical protein